MNIDKVPEMVGKEIEVKGWIWRKRESKNIIFLLVRDSNGVAQFTVKEDQPFFRDAQDLTIESSVILKGLVNEDKRSPTGFEIKTTSLETVQIAERYPITKDQSHEFLLDVRHLWLRSRKLTSIMKIRDTVFDAFREYFRKEGFYEYHSPIIQSTQCEGGSTLFEIKYFDKPLYLTQTWQLHAEAGIFALEKIFTIAPSFRAEKSKTSRHLTEYWHAEMEVAWADFKTILDYGEGVLKHVMNRVLEKNKEELKILKRDTKTLEATAEKEFPRITYDDALSILKDKFNMDVPWGKDLRTIEEDKLSSLYETPVIVTHYPKEVKAFYMKEDEKNPKVVLGADFIAPEGYGEIIGSSERESDPEKIKSRLREQGEDPANYGFYLDTRIYGSVPHGGWGLGMERIISWICGLDNIKDAIPFPRTMVRYTP